MQTLPIKRTKTALALPKPETVTLTEVRSHLIPTAVDLRRQIACQGNIPAARELCRQLEAFRKYLQDRQGRDLLAAECRRTEVLIGKLLGPGKPGPPTESSPAGEDSNGVPKDDRHKFRLLAAHEEEVEKLLAEGKVSRNVILEKIQRPSRNGHHVSAETVESLESLIAAGETFGTIYADPPWRYSNHATRSAVKREYPTMTVDEIAALPVCQLAAEQSHLHLWTTNAFLFESQRVIEAWGFEYKGVMLWVKPQMGIGNYWRVSHEFLMLGVKGDCPFLARDEKSWIEANREGHSKKPQKFRRAIEKVSPSPRLELFGRELADGWRVWGNQIAASLFDGVSA